MINYILAIVFFIAGVLLFAMVMKYPTIAFLFMFCGACALFLGFCCLVFKKSKKREKLLKPLRVIIIIGVAAVLISFTVIQVKIQGFEPANMDKPADAVIVLGAGLLGDRPSWTLSNRLRIAAEYLEAHPDVMVIVSGGQGPDEWVSEALAMERYLMELGIDAERIIKEDKSSNTIENLENSQKILAEMGMENAECMVVSSEFHLYRAQTIAGQIGLNMTGGLGAGIPPVTGLSASNHLREYFSVVLVYMKILVGRI